MKFILWAASEEVAFKAEVEDITVEEADVAMEEDFMVDVDKESNMAEEVVKAQYINGPDFMPEWCSVTMARR